MSEPGKAVFLSYASQDAEAAKKIADALRAAGVEVWFDQSELVGGDAWDAKIRKQIKDCALLIPIISANTQSRTEGYFRLEWRLADQRTHLMGRGRAFLLPVCIDDTKDADADVPDSFSVVQWTRLPGGETPTKFVEQVKRLLSGDVGRDLRRRLGGDGEAIPPAGQEAGFGDPALQRRGPSRWWWALPMFGVAMALLLVLKEGRKDLVPSAPAAAPSAKAVTAVSAEVASVRARIIPDHWQKSDFEAVSVTLDRLIQADPENADAWALRSIINSLQVTRNADAGTTPLNAGKAAAERSLRIAPGNPLGELALGLHHVTMISRGGDVQAARVHIERGVAGLPPDALARYAELVSYWLAFQFAETERCARVWLAAEPSASFPAWILAQMNLAARHPAEAVQWAEKAAADQDVTGVRALATMFEARYYLQADLPGARAALDRQTVGGRTVHRVVFARWLLAMAERRWDIALQELARLPEPILFDRNFHGPKALLAGLAQRAAGRPEAMAAQFREAERLSREEMSRDPDNEELHAVLALTLACTGRAAEARAELAAIEPLMGGRAPNVYAGQPIVLVAQTHAELGEPAETARWLRKLFVEPSIIVFTPASLRLDPRFASVVGAPEIQALLKEFAALDQPRADATAPKVDDKSIAVLPFENMSEEKDSAFFADGIHEDILTNLSNIRELRVVSRTSVMQYRATTKTMPQIARELGVTYILEGSVRRAGNKVRVTGQLIKAGTDEHVWAKAYDRDLTDIFTIQAELAQAIAGALQTALSPQEKSLIERRPTDNLAAYELVLKARDLGNRPQWSTAGIQEARRLLQNAVQLDPNYAVAYADLVYVTAFGHYFINPLASDDPRKGLLEQAKTAMDTALRLAPDSPDTIRALGDYYYYGQRDFARAIEQYEKLIRLRPNDATPWLRVAAIQRRQARWNESMASFRKAEALDPGNLRNVRDLGVLFAAGHRYAEAIAQQRRVLERRPDDLQAGFELAELAYLQSGSTREMEQFFAGLPPAQADSEAGQAYRKRWALYHGDLADAVRLDRPGPFAESDGTFGNFVNGTLDVVIALAAQGDMAGARARLGDYPAVLRARVQGAAPDYRLSATLAKVEALLGHREEALRLVQQAVDLSPESGDALQHAAMRANFAFVLAWTGDKDRAIAEHAKMLRLPYAGLEGAGGYNTTNVHVMKTAPDYAPLRGDPRFEALLNDPRNNAPLF